MSVEHEWRLVDAVQISDGSSVINLDWECINCGKDWGTCSGVVMPNEESGECGS